MKDTIEKKDSTGWNAKCKEVLDTAFQIVDNIIKDGMTDEEKVKAIHDYLIYNVNYVNNGDYEHAEKWAYGASGVLLHHADVCNSYAVAFHIMAESVGIECEYVLGVATNSIGLTNDHAWNRVKLNGLWYYLDCTWNDPVGGGAERYDYYLSEQGWANHIIQDCRTFDNGDKFGLEYNLSGE